MGFCSALFFFVSAIGLPQLEFGRLPLREGVSESLAAILGAERVTRHSQASRPAPRGGSGVPAALQSARNAGAERLDDPEEGAHGQAPEAEGESPGEPDEDLGADA